MSRPPGVGSPARNGILTAAGVRYAPAARGASRIHRAAPERRAARALGAALVWLGTTLAAPADGRAQAVPRFASPHVPPDHWAMAAAARLAGLGLAPPGFGWGERSLTRRELASVLRVAAERATDRAPRYAALARGYLLRFTEEFGPTAEAAAEDDPRGLRRTGGSLDAGFDRRVGVLLGGIGYDNATDWTGPLPAGDVSTALAGGSLTVAAFPHVALRLAAELRARGSRVRAAEATVALRDVGLWLGRRRVGFGPGAGGGIVLSGASALDGAGIHLIDPVTLPGWLGRLGPVRFQAAITRVRNGDRIRDPWLWAARFAFAPHPRLHLGLSRAVMFGGEGNAPWTLRNLAFTLIGKHSGAMGEFDNQVFALDAHYRPPVDALPLVLYLEWGIDDSAGAIKDVPAIVAGLFVPALPGSPEVSLRIERTSFAAACCGNTIWYRNWAFRGGWTDAGRPLGHPLGGHGREWLAEVRADLNDARVRIAAGGRLRRRGAENLFAPDRQGASTSAWIAAGFRASADLELAVTGTLEHGDRGWRQSAVDVDLRWLFR
ncbi:MAG TPA: capsule assembly Wzi family protein [Longimicrobiales bacterium]